MPGLVPGIYVFKFIHNHKVVDRRDEPGDDE
jgi:hypothetical protein